LICLDWVDSLVGWLQEFDLFRLGGQLSGLAARI
jgi:hypothetical protein